MCVYVWCMWYTSMCEASGGCLVFLFLLFHFPWNRSHHYTRYSFVFPSSFKQCPANSYNSLAHPLQESVKGTCMASREARLHSQILMHVLRVSKTDISHFSMLAKLTNVCQLTLVLLRNQKNNVAGQAERWLREYRKYTPLEEDPYQMFVHTFTVTYS